MTAPASPPSGAAALWLRLEAIAIIVLGWLGMPAEMARQLVRFVAVGLVAAVAYVAIMAAMIDGLGTGVLVAAFCAFVLGTAVSFYGNALWSFGNKPTPGKAVWFFAVNTVGLSLNMLIAWGLERAGVHYLLISLAVLIIVPLFNFAGHRLFTFSR